MAFAPLVLAIIIGLVVGAARKGHLRAVAGARIASLPSLRAGDNLLQEGATSLDIIRIVNMLDQEFGFRPRIDQFYASPTVAFLSNQFEQQGASGAKEEAQPVR